MAYLSEDALAGIGFREVGRNVLTSERASIYGAEHISIGANVRLCSRCAQSGARPVGAIHYSAGTPARKRGDRARDLLELERRLPSTTRGTG